MRLFHKALLITLAAGLFSSALGQDAYPIRPVRMIIPYGSGGVSDIMGRVVAQKMSELFSQPIVVENRAGAGGMLGTSLVAKSPPDGYVIVLSSLSAYAIGPRLVRDAPMIPSRTLPLLGVWQLLLPF